MSYFSKFPKTIITLGDSSYIIRDILRRVSISEDFRKNVALLEDYFVRDSETPELVSNILYNSPTYHWIILMVNDIVDVRTEWPLPNERVIDLIYQKYDFEVSVPDESVYSNNDVVTSSAGGEFLVTNTETGKVFLRSQNGKTLLAISDTLTNVTTDTSGLTLTAVTDPEEDVHHYYDPEIELIVDSGYSSTTVPVTNYIHEYEINDKKRLVKVINPTYISFFVRQFEDLVNS